MTPKEIQRDQNGRTRLGRIEEADRQLSLARLMAAAYVADPNRGFEEFAQEGCKLCGSTRECGENMYLARIEEAAALYRSAGLGLLGSRVKALLRRPPAVAWPKFDRLNSATEVMP
jgi:hypothetical protein